MKLYRLAKERRGYYRADDLSGNGAALAGGRWNPHGMRVVYTCLHASTALLEALVHMAGLMPAGGYHLVTLELPDAIYDEAFTPTPPDGWADLTRDPETTMKLGQQWLEAGKQLAMRVPSVVCSIDFNLLLNPSHPDMKAVKVVGTVPFTLDPRLFGHAPK
ncbi:RES family NAD+ phosphorylase [Burkholderia cenocepacia]|uniref:RES family NAD+ phosphorylase n=1 Tax=Burkholderia cenocepacia TaxID=95486 RepID=UPI000D9EE849|nr:RES family NAD+ phosphorylase [Burkholderia cenocepacia]ELK7720671.1 RES family NAD+ phosphorylase [Burkholderia cenocepacia]MCA7963738.1 RES family NAD+ phosphorylase [Burkholderia cenocepacia]MCW3605142.1 RES family NAD+ phosphorylase [Burkholderia cenocepacia]MCW5191730.1 RES family NAD+ phosphorylase [Burkholderia cenocepacia]MDR8031892.1 RES family NAD+ phosphorylase [Burkholderia cenocepacia]